VRFVILKPILVKLLKVEEMSDVLLDRPRVANARGQYYSGERSRNLLDTGGCTAKSGKNTRKVADGKIEVEASLSPRRLIDHLSCVSPWLCLVQVFERSPWNKH